MRFVQVAAFVGLAVTAFGAGHAHANNTSIRFCNDSSQTVYGVVYEHSGGLRSNEFAEGWYVLSPGRCELREVIYAYERRAYAFIALDENQRVVALPIKFDTRGPRPRWSLSALCVPVQEKLNSFTNTSAIAPPCGAGFVPIRTSLNAQGGNEGDQYTFYIPDGMPAYDPAYARAWDERFGVKMATVGDNSEENSAYDAAQAELAKRILESIAKKREEETKEPEEPEGSVFADAFNGKEARRNQERLISQASIVGRLDKIKAACLDVPEQQLCSDFEVWTDKQEVRLERARLEFDWIERCKVRKYGGSMTIAQEHDADYRAQCRAEKADIDALEETIEKDALFELEQSMLAALE